MLFSSLVKSAHHAFPAHFAHGDSQIQSSIWELPPRDNIPRMLAESLAMIIGLYSLVPKESNGTLLTYHVTAGIGLYLISKAGHTLRWMAFEKS